MAGKMSEKCRVFISTVLTQNGANYDGDGSEPPLSFCTRVLLFSFTGSASNLQASS